MNEFRESESPSQLDPAAYLERAGARFRASLFSEISWAISAQVLNLIAGLTTLKVWAAYLTPDELGLTAFVIGGASILVGVVIGPLTQSIFVNYAHFALGGEERKFRTVTGGMVARHAVAVILLLLVAGETIAYSHTLHWTVPFAVAGLFAVDAWRAFEEALLASARRQREVGIIAVADVWLRLAFVWSLLHFLQPSANAAIAGNVLGAIASALVIRLSLRLEAFPGEAHVAVNQQRSIRAKISGLARPLFPSALLVNLTGMANRYIIGATIGLHAAGIFVLCYGLVARPYGMLNHVTSMTMTPVLSGAIAARDLRAIRRAKQIWIALAACGAAVGTLLFYSLREPIVAILLSNHYLAARDLLPGFTIAFAIFNLCNVVNWFLIVTGDSRSVLISNGIGCIATLSLTVVMCLLMGVPGAVWALVVGYLLQLLYSGSTYCFGKDRFRTMVGGLSGSAIDVWRIWNR